MEHTMKTGTMNRTQKRIIVPPSEDIVGMTDTELAALRAELVEAQQLTEAQISAARHSGGGDPDWLIRSNGALAHFRRGLSVIKSELVRRNGGRDPGWMTPDVHTAFDALDAVRAGLRTWKSLHDAVCRFLDDDSDDNFAELERLVGRG